MKVIAPIYGRNSRYCLATAKQRVPSVPCRVSIDKTNGQQDTIRQTRPGHAWLYICYGPPIHYSGRLSLTTVLTPTVPNHQRCPGGLTVLIQKQRYLLINEKGRLLKSFSLFEDLAIPACKVRARKQQAVREAATICPRPMQVDLCVDLLTLKVVSESRVTWATYLCANFSLPGYLCSRLRPDVRNRQTDVRRASSFNASVLWGRRHNKQFIGQP